MVSPEYCAEMGRQIDELEEEVAMLRRAIGHIEQIVRTPTEGKMRAYTHFMRDFDEIRALCRKTLEAQ